MYYIIPYYPGIRYKVAIRFWLIVFLIKQYITDLTKLFKLYDGAR